MSQSRVHSLRLEFIYCNWNWNYINLDFILRSLNSICSADQVYKLGKDEVE